MRSKVYVKVGCPSVHLSIYPIRPLQQRVVGLLLWAQEVGDINCCMASTTAQQQCRKCHDIYQLF